MDSRGALLHSHTLLLTVWGDGGREREPPPHVACSSERVRTFLLPRASLSACLWLCISPADFLFSLRTSQQAMTDYSR